MICGTSMLNSSSYVPKLKIIIRVKRFLSFLAISRLTVVFEILQPDNQHIEDLSYLSEYVFHAF